eukprot:c43263_g1_i1 orf=2-220(-)
MQQSVYNPAYTQEFKSLQSKYAYKKVNVLYLSLSFVVKLPINVGPWLCHKKIKRKVISCMFFVPMELYSTSAA